MPKPKNVDASLERYRKKRDFTKTPEPRPELVEGPPPGDPDASARNLVFVVQQHAARRMHWDFRLEVDGVLKSWPLPNGPTLDPKVRRLAVMTEDHPYEYRNFEGVIPKGEYGGGQVIVWDEGIYTPDEDGVTSWDDKEEGSRRMNEGIAKGKVSVTLQGKKLRGSFALVKTKYAPDSWLMIKHKDEHVSDRDVLLEDKSVRSGLTIADLKEGRLPNAATAALEAHPAARQAPFLDSRKEKPMLATLVDEAFDRQGWLWEPKLDGVRALAFVKDGRVEIKSRRGIDMTKQYAPVAEALARQPAQTIVLDGEVCALDEGGVPRFQLLQTYGKSGGETPLVYFVFDLLYLDGYDLRAVPLRERKALLETHLRSSENVRLVSYVEEDGPAVEKTARRLGFEGVVGKRSNSPYQGGVRGRTWLKVKAVQEQEFVVGGYTPGEGSRAKHFGALVLGYYDDEGPSGEGLRWAGNVGSGFNDEELREVQKQLERLETDESPFADKLPSRPKLTWLKPELVAQVKFAEWTDDAKLRAPVFVGLRDDKLASQVRRELPADADVVVSTPAIAGSPRGSAVGGDVEGGRSPSDVDAAAASVLAQLENPKATFPVDVQGETIKLTNLDKEFWPPHNAAPALLKRDLIAYYVKVAPWLLPHLRDRPLTLTRYPNGIAAAPFYQKHYEQPIPGFVETVSIWSQDRKKDGEYILCNNLATLVWLAQLADLELHASMARVEPEPDAHGRTKTFSGSEAKLEASALNYPDFMVFDLDPYIYSGEEAEGAEPEFNVRAWKKSVEIALSLKELLDSLKLSSFVKTTGKTGIHIYVPILRHYDYDEVRVATQTLGRFLIQEHPKDVTMEWDTSKRSGKIFFDANQNTRGKTLAAQYSLRPTPWAGVSAPIAWSALARIEPLSLNLRSVPERLAKDGDPWADILSRKNDLASLLA
ncbi:MAG TPA: non-homologous end-joining DNA ligase [Dehalococcoidia bacterium]|nr:non-homologous end-joining DNA ligase [Dehalococcoidia bacterium]